MSIFPCMVLRAISNTIVYLQFPHGRNLRPGIFSTAALEVFSLPFELHLEIKFPPKLLNVHSQFHFLHQVPSSHARKNPLQCLQ